MKTKAQKLQYWLGVIAVGLVFGLSIQFVTAWVNPTQVPPNGNVGAPINTGANPQWKTGRLGVGTAVAPTETLEVGGVIKSSLGGAYNQGGIKLAYHSLNSNSNGWLYLGNQNGSVYGDRGLAANALWAQSIMYTPTLCLNGDCRSAWPGGDLTTRSSIGSCRTSHAKGYTCDITSFSNKSYDINCFTTIEYHGEWIGYATNQMGNNNWGYNKDVYVKVTYGSGRWTLTSIGKENNHNAPAYTTKSCNTPY